MVICISDQPSLDFGGARNTDGQGFAAFGRVASFGFVVARFGLFLPEMAAVQGGPAPMPGFSRWFGMGLIALGVLITGAASASHLSTVRRLNSGEPFVGRPTWLGVTLAILLVIVGVAMTIYLGVSSVR